MTGTEGPRRTSRLGAALLLAAVFVAGAIAGGALEAAHTLGPRHPPRGPDGFVRHLADELTLSAPQQDSVRAILQRHKPQMDSAWAEMRPRVETLRQTIRSEIAAQLDSTQRVKFDDLNRRDAARRPGQ
ncbi:MAG: periplasmic heavy metal sensor [Gemmatimonadales bacterium]